MRGEMSVSKQPDEPSMEEILSSIRRIIAEDEAPGGKPPPPLSKSSAGDRPAAAAAAAPSPPPHPADVDVLELTEVVPEPAASTPPPEPPRRLEKMSSVRGEPAASGGAGPSAPPPSAEKADGLVSSATAMASAQALSRLARSVAGDERKPSSPAATTIEQFLIELVTPQLKVWLDANLPEIVERVVEQEVKKLARRAELL